MLSRSFCPEAYCSEAPSVFPCRKPPFVFGAVVPPDMTEADVAATLAGMADGESVPGMSHRPLVTLFRPSVGKQLDMPSPQRM